MKATCAAIQPQAAVELTMRVLLLLALVGAAFAVPKHIQKIVGGDPTTVETYPFMSNMQYSYWGLFWSQACGGTLLTSATIVSAAHCYIGDRPSEWQVRLGTSFASSGGSVHSVSELVLHPGYDNSMLTFDVAIIRLNNPATFSNSVQPARVAGPNYHLADNTEVTTIGWGTLWSGGSAPEQLQHVTIRTINHGVCAERYAYLKSQPGFQNWPDITPDMLCAGILDVGGKDACQGDSGGPLTHNNDVLVGIVSWGYGCAHATYPGVNSNVAYLSDWIAANGGN